MDEHEQFDNWLDKIAMDAHDTTHRLFTEAQNMMNRWTDENMWSPGQTAERNSGQLPHD